jgi:cohesin complex subunit SCC1
MTNAQTTVDQNAITLQGEAVDLNLLLPNVNWEFDFDEERTPAGRRERHTARQADITLASDGLDLPMSDSLMDGIGSLDGIGSADFLGLSFDPDFDDSVEVGRDAAVSRGVRESIGSRFMSRGRESVDMEVDADADVLMRSSRDPSAQPDDDPNLGFGFDMPDLGIDFDVPPLEPDREKTPGQGGSPRRSRTDSRYQSLTTSHSLAS